MRKLILTIILSASLAYSGHSQAINDSIKQTHEVTVDGTKLINIFKTSTSNTPFYLQYRYNFEKSALRLNVSYFGSSSETDNDDGDTTFTESYSNSNLRLSLGYEWQERFGNRWIVNYGVGLIYHAINSSSSRVFEDHSTGEAYRQDHTSDYDAFGIAPHAGIRFMILKNLSVGTEFSWEFLRSVDSHKNTYENAPPNSKDNSWESVVFSSRFNNPLSFLISYNF